MSTSLNVLMMPDYRRDNPYQDLLAKSLHAEGVSVHFPTGYRRVLPLARFAASHADASVLHLHWTDPYLRGQNAASYAIYAAKLAADVACLRARGIRIVWTVHNRGSHEARFPGVEQRLQRHLAGIADAVIFHSAVAAKESVKRWGFDEGKAAVIPHGHYRGVYGIPVPAAKARQALNLPPHGRVYLYFGLIRPYKGVDDLLNAWPAHHEAFPEDTLVIAGQAPEEAYGASIKALAEGRSSVRLMTGRIADPEVNLLFSACDCTVLPFRGILTSGSFLLALSYARPVIAPKLPTLVETAGPASRLFYEPDNGGLVHALKQSASIDLAALQRQAAIACDQFDWRGIARQTKAVYQPS